MFDAIGSFFTTLLTPLYYAVSGIMIAWHWAFTKIGMDYDSGWTWALSIIGLTVTIRAMLIPLFVKQIKSSRNMQLLQPKIKELQKKYGHDRERLAQEQMKLWKDSGTNPFASCLPLILQMPIFFALFHMINSAADGEPKGFLTQNQADSIKNATLMGARIADQFTTPGVDINVKILCGVLVVLMCATTFMTQRQLMSKNMPKDAMSGPYAQQQKMLLYVLPFVFAIGGIAFPVGVLLYWTTSNAWTMGQQFYVIRNNPAPGTPAFKAKQERDKAHGRGIQEDPTILPEEEQPKPPPRQQPKKQTRNQRKSVQGPGPSGRSNQAKPNPNKKQKPGSPGRSNQAKPNPNKKQKPGSPGRSNQAKPNPNKKQGETSA